MKPVKMPMANSKPSKKLIQNSLTAVFLWMLFASVEVYAQQNPQPCRSQPEYRQFDFWVGEWEVRDENGQILGSSKVELILDGCVIFENWISARSGYMGKSFNYYNRLTGKWQQKWIDNRGVPIEFEGEYNAEIKALMFEGVTRDSSGNRILYQLNFYNKNYRQVRQLWKKSTDGGKSWEIIFDGYYRKK